MKNEFIPYEQALALKELGFNEPCFAFYIDLELKRSLVKNFEECKNSNWDAITAPLYQQVFRWFREKHNLYSFVFKFNEGFGYETYKEGVTQTNDSFDTYKEAESACLIKLIEIVKQNDRNRRVE